MVERAVTGRHAVPPARHRRAIREPDATPDENERPSPRADPVPEASAADLLAGARAGDAAAWDRLVERYSGLIWAIARAHRLDAATASDVSQVTWLRLVEHLDTVREPERLGAWLATTARRECLRAIRAGRRDVLVDDDAVFERDQSRLAGPEEAVLGSERDAALRRALESLPDRCHRLLRLLLAVPAPSYDEVSAALEMPVGSIGPTRARCLACLRRSRELRDIV